MGSMNSNNWLSFPLSPTNSSLPLNLHASQAHQFSLGLVNDNMETPFQSQGINPPPPAHAHIHMYVYSLFFLIRRKMIYIYNPFCALAEWNLLNTHGSSEVPKIADFLGVSKSENQADLEAFNEIQGNDSDYFFPNNSILPVPNPIATAVAVSPNSYEFQENNNNLQSLTLSMGSGKGSTCETSGNSSNSIVEAAPRRTLDTFGQRTSIYRGVTRWVLILV